MVKHSEKSFQTSKGVRNILTRQEVLELFSITPPTLREWQRKGLLKGTKINRRVFFSVDEIDALFNVKSVDNGKQ